MPAGHPQSVKEIQLTQGKVALVSAEDYEFLMQWKWHYSKRSKNRSGYAKTNMPPVNGKKFTIFMHQAVAKRVGVNGLVDHINRNGLDNRRENLRPATRQQNAANKTKNPNTSSKYKGVCWRKDRQKWQAYIRVNYKSIHLGMYQDEWQAAEAYNRAATLYFDEFANLNKKEKRHGDT